MWGTFFLMRIAIVALALVFFGCTDIFDLLKAGQQYDLKTVDGQPLPWSSAAGGFIASGSVKLDDDTLAERSEFTNTGSWTVTGRYQLKRGMLIIDYGMIRLAGPAERVDTFVVSGDELVLSAGGLTRRYARP